MDPIIKLLSSYAELNSSHVIELKSEPSPLEFMRFVALNTPFVVKNGTRGWRATRLWNASYFRSILEGQTVNVAVTPLGNADSPVSCSDGILGFAKPMEEDQSFEEFLDYVLHQEQKHAPGDVRYAQTQNDNLHGEYALLASDVERDIPWARIALQKAPEAVNFWLGNSHSVTALHQDNYENIYCQIVGKKHFVLLPPLSSPCVGEEDLKSMSYAYNGGVLVLCEDGGKSVRFPTWDPDLPHERATQYSHLARPMRVTLEPGDILYLPALWYHKVAQSCSPEGFSCAINYWYDMLSYSGPFLPCTDFIRDAARISVQKDINI